MSGEIRFVQGNEACVRGALYAGVRFFAGYPITPSTEIAEHLSEELPRVGGRFVQMEDEIASMCAVCGASLAGSKAMTATSGPGFSLKQEALGYAIMAEIPCVIVDVQRGGPSTGLPTECSQGDVMQARWGAHGDHPALRRPRHHRPHGILHPGRLQHDGGSLQSGRDLPHPGGPAVRRSHRSHARKAGDPGPRRPARGGTPPYRRAGRGELPSLPAP